MIVFRKGVDESCVDDGGSTGQIHRVLYPSPYLCNRHVRCSEPHRSCTLAPASRVTKCRIWGKYGVGQSQVRPGSTTIIRHDECHWSDKVISDIGLLPRIIVPNMPSRDAQSRTLPGHYWNPSGPKISSHISSSGLLTLTQS